jgi:hypothetical protein
MGAAHWRSRPWSARLPPLSARPKDALMQLLDGKTGFSFPAGKTIPVAAGKVTCRAGNVDITSHACHLSFGSQVISLTGRRAHELFATLAEIGVEPDGAADLRVRVEPEMHH